MAGPAVAHDTSDQIVLKAIHDKTGWRVQLHIHVDDQCVVLEGHARFADEDTCHEHGRALYAAIDSSIGILDPDVAKAAKTGSN